MSILHPAIIEKFKNLEILSINSVGIDKISNKTFENCGNLLEISFNRNRINEILPGVFRNCSKVKKISLNTNFIHTIYADGLLGLTSLEELDLSYSNFSNFSPEFLKHTQSLKILDLSFSRISQFDTTSTFPQSLIKLHLSSLHLTGLPPNVFRNLSNLEVLDFTSNLRLNQSSQFPPGVFEPLKSLKELHLNFTYHRRLNSNSFGRHENLTKLFMVYCLIREIEPDFFDNFPNIELIDMTGDSSCFNGIIYNASSIDFSEDLRLERCFNNWLGIEETTPTWRPPGDDDNGLKNWRFFWIIFGSSLIAMILIFNGKKCKKFIGK